MDATWMVACFLPLYLMTNEQQAQETALNLQNEEEFPMKEFAMRLVGRDVIVYTFNGTQIMGTLREVRDDALLLWDDKNGEQIVSLRYVVRLREHPVDKNGKKKSIVFD